MYYSHLHKCCKGLLKYTVVFFSMHIDECYPHILRKAEYQSIFHCSGVSINRFLYYQSFHYCICSPSIGNIPFQLRSYADNKDALIHPRRNFQKLVIILTRHHQINIIIPRDKTLMTYNSNQSPSA